MSLSSILRRGIGLQLEVMPEPAADRLVETLVVFANADGGTVLLGVDAQGQAPPATWTRPIPSRPWPGWPPRWRPAMGTRTPKSISRWKRPVAERSLSLSRSLRRVVWTQHNLGAARAGLRSCPSWLGQETGHSAIPPKN